jgi:hypothetical protein
LVATNTKALHKLSLGYEMANIDLQLMFKSSSLAQG